MEDLGFNGSGSRFNSRFEAGSPIQAKQLNDLASGIQASLPMPYLGEGPSVSFTPGGAVITGGQARIEPGQPAPASIVQQYQMRVVTVEGVERLQIAKGTVSFTQSNMPRVRQGGHSDQRQGWISKVAVYGSGVNLTSGAGDPAWMDGNGYYTLSFAGTYYVTISKFDINQSNDDTESALLNAEAPWVSIFPSGDDIESIIFSETGPSEYVNKTNVQKMVGYDAMSTGLQGDWGNCHTTWFNPVKWGYAVKLIGIVTATNVPGEGIRLSIDQHIVGPIDLQIPCLFNGTTLCNQDDLTETNDPYNLNKNATPKWSLMANADTLNGMNSLVEDNDDWYEEFVGPADWTSANYDYKLPGSCANQVVPDDDVCFPFKVKGLKYLTPEGQQPYAVYNICPGTINNLMPLIYDDVSEAWVYMDVIPQPQIALAAGTETWIVLRTGPNPVNTFYPSRAPGSPPEDDPYPRVYTLDSEPPDDTDQLAYIVLAKVTKLPDDKFAVDQYVTGSLWADRIKLGTKTATYYYARV
jgi:hypothetical protein